MNNDPGMTLSEAAGRLNVNYHRVYLLYRLGRLREVKSPFFNTIRVRTSDVENYASTRYERPEKPFVECSVDGCERQVRCSGLCASHYAMDRYNKTGKKRKSRAKL